MLGEVKSMNNSLIIITKIYAPGVIGRMVIQQQLLSNITDSSAMSNYFNIHFSSTGVSLVLAWMLPLAQPINFLVDFSLAVRFFLLRLLLWRL